MCTILANSSGTRHSKRPSASTLLDKLHDSSLPTRDSLIGYSINIILRTTLFSAHLGGGNICLVQGLARAPTPGPITCFVGDDATSLSAVSVLNLATGNNGGGIFRVG